MYSKTIITITVHTSKPKLKKNLAFITKYANIFFLLRRITFNLIFSYQEK